MTDPNQSPLIRSEGDKAATRALVPGILGLVVFPVLAPFAIGQAAKAERLGTPATPGRVLGWVGTTLLLVWAAFTVFLLVSLGVIFNSVNQTGTIGNGKLETAGGQASPSSTPMPTFTVSTRVTEGEWRVQNLPAVCHKWVSDWFVDEVVVDYPHKSLRSACAKALGASGPDAILPGLEGESLPNFIYLRQTNTWVGPARHDDSTSGGWTVVYAEPGLSPMCDAIGTALGNWPDQQDSMIAQCADDLNVSANDISATPGNDANHGNYSITVKGVTYTRYGRPQSFGNDGAEYGMTVPANP